MPHVSRNKTSAKSGGVSRVPSLYSISGNLSPSKRPNKRSAGMRDIDGQNPTESIMMGTVDRWNSSVDVSNRRANSPNHTAELDRDRPVAFVHPIIHRSPSAIEPLRRQNELRTTIPSEKIAATQSMTDLTYSGQPKQLSSSTERSAVVLEEFDNSLFILCMVSIFVNPVLGPVATYCAWRAKKAFFAASWKSFRRWTMAAHAFSSIGFGLSAVAFGMIGIKLYHMYSGIQCFYKCSFLTNNEFNWQGFWDELNKNRAELTKNN